MLRGFIVDTFTESEAGLWIPVRETQGKKRGKSLCKARNVGAREREREKEIAEGVWSCHRPLKLLMCLCFPLSSPQSNTETFS